MNKDKIFLGITLGFIAGVGFRSYSGSDPLMLIWAVLICSLAIFTVFYKNKKAVFISFLLLSLAMGIWRTDEKLKNLETGNLAGKNFSGMAVVSEEPEAKDNYKKVILKTDKNFLVLANVSLNSDLSYGDEVKINCALKIPEPIEGFDYRMYLAKDNIRYLCQSSSLEKTGNWRGNKTYVRLLDLKQKMEENINRAVPEPEAGLANGLILGGGNRLTGELRDKFSKTGMSHIVAVSGYNVTIIAEYLMFLGIVIGLWRRQAFWFSVAGIFLFVAMIGFPASAVRAGIMGSLLLWAMKNGRLANAWNAIIFSAAAMLAINPLVLRWDIGFQLSFLATAGIVAFSPFWERHLIKKHKTFGIFEIILLSLSAQIFVLPVLISNFGYVSFVSLLANVLILPMVPVSMLAVFLVAVAGSVSHGFSLIFAWLAYLPLNYEIRVIEMLSGLEWAGKNVGSLHRLQIIGWYAILSGITYWMKTRMRNNMFQK